ncbi:MAG: hypothetical protein FWE37_05885 [Spirochaetaceae bacterium]|nr:hypothetical protein [Spirochaetaceae bacterium]
MPSIDELNQFKNLINNLSDEAVWREEHGEAIENVAPPPERNSYLNDEEAEPADEEDEAANLNEPAAEGNLTNEDGADVADEIGLQEGSDLTALDEELPNFELDDFDNNLADNDDLNAFLNENITVPEDVLEEAEAPADIFTEQPDEVNEAAGAPEADDNLSIDGLDIDGLDIDDLSVGGLDDEPELNVEAGLAATEDDLTAEPLDESERAAGSFMGGISSLEIPEADTDLDFPLEEGGEEEEGSEDFNLGDFSAVFDKPKYEDMAPSLDEDSAEDDYDEEITPEKLVFTAEQLKIIREHLAKMPRNLKIALQELLINEDIPAATVYNVTRKILKQVSARNLANEVRKATGVRILVSNFYEKSTGEAFEHSQQGFRYVFVNNVWPKVRTYAAGLAFVALLTTLLLNFVYRPLQAHFYYRAGYNAIRQLNYSAALEYFRIAFEGWQLGNINIGGNSAGLNIRGVRGIFSHNWFLRYAAAFEEQREFNLARLKYGQLIHFNPRSRRAFLAYGLFEHNRADFARADAIYEQFLNTVNKNDYQIMMAQGDNLMEWGDEDPYFFERARIVYASILSTRFTDDLRVRLLNYFIKTNQPQEIRRMVALTVELPRPVVHAQIYANLAGWYLDNREYHNVVEVLRLALEHDETVPAVHYQLARYFNIINERAEERMALNLARAHLEMQTPFSRAQLEMSINIYARLGRLLLREGETRQAEIAFLEALRQYEDAKDRRVLSPSSRHASIYAELGRLYYNHSSDFNSALIFFDRAVLDGYDTANVRYKMGVIYYNRDDFELALHNFYLAHEMDRYNRNILFSLATTFAARESFALSQGFYFRLINELEEDRLALSAAGMLADLDILELSSLLMRAYNNISVVYYHLGNGSSEQGAYLMRSLDALNSSSTAWNLYVNQRGEWANDLAFTNRNHISVGQGNLLQLYDALPLTTIDGF